jgi:EpsI family protein
LLVAFGLIAAAQLIVIAIHEGSDPQPSPLPHLGPDTLPDVIGDYRGRDVPLDPRLTAATNSDAILNRVYENRMGDQVIVNVGVWIEYGRGIPHPPGTCYPMAGWEVVSRRNSKIPLEDGGFLKAMTFLFQRDESRAAVAYWAQLGDETVTHVEQVRPIFQRLRQTGDKMPPLVKVMLHTNAVDFDQANARLLRFAAILFPHTNTIR